MNVGGHRLSNDELRGHFSAMGLREVACFRASGNVVFTAAGRSPATLAAGIEEGLVAALGYAVPTFVRRAAELRRIAADRPFAADQVQASVGKLHVALLSTPASARTREEVLSLGSDRDRLVFGERELYWLPSGRMIDSGLDLKAVESFLGVMTLRTKNTIELIASRYFAD
jgi:uncharacterized protein (DUF1697 family)